MYNGYWGKKVYTRMNKDFNVYSTKEERVGQKWNFGPIHRDSQNKTKCYLRLLSVGIILIRYADDNMLLAEWKWKLKQFGERAIKESKKKMLFTTRRMNGYQKEKTKYKVRTLKLIKCKKSSLCSVVTYGG